MKILDMLRPNFNEQETEKKEETFSSETTSRRANLSLTTEYPSVNRDFLNSEVFIDEGTNVLIARPQDMEDAEVIADAILAGKAVLVLLDTLDRGMDQRILDFINGICYPYGIAPRQIPEEKKYVVDPMHKRSTRNYR